MIRKTLRFLRLKQLQIFCFCIAATSVFLIIMFGEEKELAITGIASSFFGALAAFSLSAVNDVRKEKKQQAGDINEALLKMAHAYNDVLNLKKNTLDKYGNSYGLVVECQPMPPPDFDKYRINFSAISFLAEKNPNMMLDLGTCEQCLQMLTLSVSERNYAFQKMFHPKALEAGLLGRNTTKEQFRIALSDYVMNTLESASYSFEGMLLAAIEDLEKNIVALGQCGKELLPSYGFIEIDRKNADSAKAQRV